MKQKFIRFCANLYAFPIGLTLIILSVIYLLCLAFLFDFFRTPIEYTIGTMKVFAILFLGLTIFWIVVFLTNWKNLEHSKKVEDSQFSPYTVFGEMGNYFYFVDGKKEKIQTWRPKNKVAKTIMLPRTGTVTFVREFGTMRLTASVEIRKQFVPPYEHAAEIFSYARGFDPIMEDITRVFASMRVGATPIIPEYLLFQLSFSKFERFVSK